MLTDTQINYAVEFWGGRLRPRVSEDVSRKFEKALAKVLKDDRDIKALSCHFGPHSGLEEALDAVGLLKHPKGHAEEGKLKEPPILLDNVDMVFNQDGSIDMRVDNHWRSLKPEEL